MPDEIRATELMSHEIGMLSEQGFDIEFGTDETVDLFDDIDGVLS